VYQVLRIDDVYVVRLCDGGGEVISERWFASKKKAINHYRRKTAKITKHNLNLTSDPKGSSL